MPNITKYARIEAGGIAIYRAFNKESVKEIQELVREYGKIEILEIDQECFAHRLKMLDDHPEYLDYFLERFGKESDMSHETFDKIAVGVKLLMFDALFGLPI